MERQIIGKSPCIMGRRLRARASFAKPARAHARDETLWRQISHVAGQGHSQKDRISGAIGILGWVEQLAQVNTDGVAPLASVSETKLFWREDAVTDGGMPDKVLANAPDAADGYFLVPKVVE
jgi:aspartyl-tRNA(Asn)/glutamyl-tRNA(Gln) amidotransferase subunit C